MYLLCCLKKNFDLIFDESSGKNLFLSYYLEKINRYEAYISRLTQFILILKICIYLHKLQQVAVMKVICAGAPKTGTKSLAKALRYLGYENGSFFLVMLLLI